MPDAPAIPERVKARQESKAAERLAAAAAAANSAYGAFGGVREAPDQEVIEILEPNAISWFDDIDTVSPALA